MMRIPEEIRKKPKKEVAATRAWRPYLSKIMRAKASKIKIFLRFIVFGQYSCSSIL
ncbi:hypothetical protein HMPREF9422_1751 [Streptococcus cristatus ATCC 51100]|nr:hypothetical protein HMPREF9422_1751 [Streptococcus cristatus ATCC 51100]